MNAEDEENMTPEEIVVASLQIELGQFERVGLKIQGKTINTGKLMGEG